MDRKSVVAAFALGLLSSGSAWAAEDAGSSSIDPPSADKMGCSGKDGCSGKKKDEKKAAPSVLVGVGSSGPAA